jgi:serine/threonine protein kinase
MQAIDTSEDEKTPEVSKAKIKPLKFKTRQNWDAYKIKIVPTGFVQQSLLNTTLMGGLHLVRNQKTNELTVLKTFCITKPGSPENVETEAVLHHLISKANHPSIVKFLAFGHDAPQKCTWIELEYIQGTELLSEITSGKVTLPLAKKYTRQIASALNTIHALGLVYLDVSTENIIINNENNIKLVDFGVTRKIGLGTHDIAVVPKASILSKQPPLVKLPGKLNYLAPELFYLEPMSPYDATCVKTRSSPSIPPFDFVSDPPIVYDSDLKLKFDGRCADVFSLGVCMFMMLTKLPPFTQADPQTDMRYQYIANGWMRRMLYQWTLDDPYDALWWQNYMTDELVELLQDLMCRNPKKRPTLAQLLSHPWLVSLPSDEESRV